MNALKTFLLKKMQMTGPYQPLVIKHLIRGNGRAELESIAKEVAVNDLETVSVFVDRLKIHPRSVLKKHGICEIPRNKNYFETELVNGLSEDEKKELIQICDQKVKEWAKKQSLEVSTNNGWGRKRLEMIEKTPFCSLCGSKPNPSKKVLREMSWFTKMNHTYFTHGLIRNTNNFVISMTCG